MADSIIAKIRTLFEDKEGTIPLFPRTKIKAVSDDDGTALNVLLDDMNNDISTAQSTADTAKNNAATAKSTTDTHIANKSNPHGVTKSQVGLGNVTNVQQMPIAGGTFTGVVTMVNQNYVGGCGRNILVQNKEGTSNMSTQYIIMQRK